MTDITYQIVKPAPELTSFVESIWMLANPGPAPKPAVLVPDGRIDLIFEHSRSADYHVTLHGLESEPGQVSIPPGALLFAVSFKLPAVEYVLGTATGLNTVTELAPNFWGINAGDLLDFQGFCQKVTQHITTLIKPGIDVRKRKLFELIYSSSGAMSVQDLAGEVQWSSRQINRYFTQKFGISLKAYCNILRFRASFEHIKAGKLFPEQNFTDQAHFIRDVKKFAGVTPKELHKNPGDRFIQFFALPRK
jgi:AraC-like DNA-binding protein